MALPLKNTLAKPTHGSYLYGPKLVAAVITLNAANSVSFADILSATVLLPAVAKHFGGSESTEFAPAAQLIGATVGQCLLGYFSDIWSRRSMILVALTIMIISNITSGISGFTDVRLPALFVGCRAFAGVASGSISNLVNIAQNDISPDHRRLKLQGVQGASVALGSIFGTVVGAVFLQAGKWQGFYFILAGLSSLAWIAVFFFVPSNMAKSDRKKVWHALLTIDWLGILFGSVSITCLLLLLCKHDRLGVLTQVVLSVIGGICLLVFIILGFKNLPGVRPIIPFHIFKNLTIATINFQNVIIGAAYYSFIFFIPITLQVVRHMNPIKAAGMCVAYFVTHGVWTALSSRIIVRLQNSGRPSYSVIFYVGYVSWTLAMSLLAYDSIKQLNNGMALIAITVLVGIGTGSVFQNSVMAITAQAAPEDKATALSTRNVLRFFGGAVGTTIASTILRATLEDKLPDELMKLAHDAVFELARDRIIGKDHLIVEDAYAVAISRVFYTASAGLGLCLLVTPLIQEIPSKKKNDRIDHDPEPTDSTGQSTPVAGDGNGNQEMAERSWV